MTYENAGDIVMNVLSLNALFDEIAIKSLRLKNRIVMAPMTRSFSPHGVPGDNVAEYYRRRAEGGVGLILSEGTVVDRPASANDPNVPHFHGAEALAGWKNVIDRVHGAGGRMGPQLWHVGAVANRRTDASLEGVEGPSGLFMPGKPLGKAMSEEDVADTIAAFGRAASDARRLGFDTVEIHAAHGYLIDQFFWSETNLRSDLYGGPTIRQRARFGVEVVKAARAAVGPDIPVIIRLSQWKQQDFHARIATTPDEMSDWLLPLVEAGADVLHCSQRRFWEAEFPEIDGAEGLNFAGWAKKLTGAVTVTVGSVGLSSDFIGAFAGASASPASLDGLVRRLEDGEFDLVAVGRALLSDPAWTNRLKTGQAIHGFNASDLASLT